MIERSLSRWAAAHQSLAPVGWRQIERQLCPAVDAEPLVKTADADKLIIVLCCWLSQPTVGKKR